MVNSLITYACVCPVQGAELSAQARSTAGTMPRSRKNQSLIQPSGLPSIRKDQTTSTPLPDAQAQAPSAGQDRHCAWTCRPQGGQETNAETNIKPPQIQVTLQAAAMTPPPRAPTADCSTCRARRKPNIQNKRKKVSFFLIMIETPKAQTHRKLIPTGFLPNRSSAT